MLIDFRRLKKSFKFALNGIRVILKKEQNFRIHFSAAIIVILLGFAFNLPLWQWIIIILLIFFVFILEIFNTVVERMIDMLKPRVHIYAKEAKDLMSAAVLIMAIVSIIVGTIIFIPHIIDKF